MFKIDPYLWFKCVGGGTVLEVVLCWRWDCVGG